MARTFAIGDIHGALKALEQLIGKLNVQQDDTIIFLGDYVDGWSQSAQVIDYLMQLQQYCNCSFIKGNHDAWCEEWMQGKLPDPVWLRNGGRETIASYDSISPERKMEHLAFFNWMRLYYLDSENRLFLHAGFASMHGPEKEHYDTNFYWDRTLWEMALTMDRRIKKDSLLYPKRLLLFNEIYIGHTPTLHYDVEIPMQGCNVWNIDTGAGFYGKLSCIDIESKEFWQSDVVQTLYPNEKGRNK